MLFYITNSRFLRTQWTPTCVGVTVFFSFRPGITHKIKILRGPNVGMTIFLGNEIILLSSYRRRPVSIVHEHSGPLLRRGGVRQYDGEGSLKNIVNLIDLIPAFAGMTKGKRRDDKDFVLLYAYSLSSHQH